MKNSKIIALLEQVLNGLVSARSDFDVKSAECMVEPNSLEEACLHVAGHFIDDFDIRSREPIYDDLMRRDIELNMKKLLATPE
jgi:hypothetical protein